jgi:hypothetical protein
MFEYARIMPRHGAGRNRVIIGTHSPVHQRRNATPSPRATESEAVGLSYGGAPPAGEHIQHC